ncbi:hypothetical protein BMF94_0798 [Rhodotorula taiwanensis]|uniref:Uncharacterized protein n=1 Tax=Rhodotorula taiwanensis TaxID=741276 RepID=A0A2S5BH43_9BASI|nr:hypothetical protein BMF94_0798 [Rhodotorula taiwanensis]
MTSPRARWYHRDDVPSAASYPPSTAPLRVSQLARFFHMLGKRNFPRLRSAPTFQVPLFIAAGTRSPPLVSSLSDLLNPDRIKMVALLIAFVTLWSTLTAVQAVLSTAGGNGIIASTSIDEQAKAQDLSLKEVCYLELYKEEDYGSLEYSKEVLVQDKQSRNVYVSDGYKESTDGATYVYRSFCYKQYHYSEHTQTTFGDSGAGAIVDGGIGNAFRNKKVDSNGISADDGTLQRPRNDKELSGDGASHNL